MSYMDQLNKKKASKLIRVIKEDEYDEFPDAIYSKPLKKNQMRAWLFALHKFGKTHELSLDDSMILLDLERVVSQLILMTSCLSDSTPIGDPNNNSHMDKAAEWPYPVIEALFIGAFEANKMDTKEAKAMLEIFKSLDEGIEEDEEDEEDQPEEDQPEEDQPETTGKSKGKKKA